MSYRGNPPYYVPSACFADILSDLIYEAGEDVVTEHADGTVTVERIGGVEQIARHMPTFIDGVKSESIPRRLWAILNKETYRVSTEVADAILLTQNRSITQDFDLPTFPAQLEAGREMVRVHNEDTLDPINDIEMDFFVRKMIRFCKAYSISVATDDLEEAMDTAWDRCNTATGAKSAVA